MKIAIATDSTSGLSREEAARLDVTVLAMPVTIDDRDYHEGEDLTPEFFFRRQAEGAVITTSQVAPSVLTDLWESLLETHDYVIHIPMTSGLSSSCAMSRGLSAEYDGRVLVADARRISVPLWQTVNDARLLADRGLAPEEIVRRLEDNALNSSIYILPTTLEYLKKGGRITPAAAAIGTVLNIKPVLQIQGGGVDAYAKVRGTRQAMDKMFAALDEDLATRFAGKKVRVFAAYSGDASVGEEWKAKMEAHYGDLFVRMDPLALNICCHTGPGAVALGCAVYEE